MTRPRRPPVRRGEPPLPPGRNSHLIAMAMKEDGIRGNVRDFVILDGTGTLITYLSDYWVTLTGTDDPVDVRHPTGELSRMERSVIHRRNLWRYIGREEAKKFWCVGLRTRS